MHPQAGFSPLHAASEMGDLTSVETLLSAQADPAARAPAQARRSWLVASSSAEDAGTKERASIQLLRTEGTKGQGPALPSGRNSTHELTGKSVSADIGHGRFACGSADTVGTLVVFDACALDAVGPDRPAALVSTRTTGGPILSIVALGQGMFATGHANGDLRVWSCGSGPGAAIHRVAQLNDRLSKNPAGGPAARTTAGVRALLSGSFALPADYCGDGKQRRRSAEAAKANAAASPLAGGGESADGPPEKHLLISVGANRELVAWDMSEVGGAVVHATGVQMPPSVVAAGAPVLAHLEGHKILVDGRSLGSLRRAPTRRRQWEESSL